MPDDHSEVEPLLPIPNRTVKRFSADDSEHSLVKVGHRQAVTKTALQAKSLEGCSIFSDRYAEPQSAAGCVPSATRLQPLRRRLSLAVLGGLSGCGLLTTQRPSVMDSQERAVLRELEHQPARFSDLAADAALPPTWEPYVLVRSKKPTVYELAAEGAQTVLRARAIGKAATGLFHRILPNPGRVPLALTWAWQSQGPAAEADVTDTWADDSPARIIAAFDGDIGQFGLRDRVFFEQVRLLTGIDLPYATLIYVWDPRLPVGTVVTVPQTTRIRYIVVETGFSSVGRWTAYQRDLIQDYRLVFEATPGPLSAVGLMTDSDDIGQSVQTLYQDIRLAWGPAS